MSQLADIQDYKGKGIDTNWTHSNHIDVLNQSLSGKLDKQFNQMYFHLIEQRNRQDDQTETFACLNITLGDPKTKVDTRVEGNILPCIVFRKCSQKSQLRWIVTSWLYISGNSSAYNGATIPQHGSVNIQCTYNHEWNGMEKYQILCVYLRRLIHIELPSLRKLKLITVHCDIQQIKCPINSTGDLMKMYPDCYDKVWRIPHCMKKTITQLSRHPENVLFLLSMKSKLN